MRQPTAVNGSKPPAEGLEWSMSGHLRDVADEGMRAQNPLLAAIDEFGGLEAWLDHCRSKKRADPDRQLVRILESLIRDTVAKPRGTLLREGEWKKLRDDKRLATYWKSVADAGDDGWQEERQRIRQAGSIRRLLPTYRAWGQVLIDAEPGSGGDGSSGAAENITPHPFTKSGVDNNAIRRPIG